MEGVTVSTHVLDTATGRPAAAVSVTLAGAGGELRLMTGDDGRGRFPGELPTGVYRIRFDASAHSALYVSVTLEVRLDEPRHYHLPMLISPYGLSAYRGS